MPEPTVFNGRYQLHRRLGRGGMAEVFLARDLQLDRPVAVKVLFPEFAGDPAFVARFRREAQAAANLNHPNIVGVYDWGSEHGTYFIVMEYVDGRSLADIIRADGPMPPNQAVEVATDVAAALGHAHAAGVLHRDIKPGNILVTPSGLVKVADWGIGRALDAAAEENLTQTGAVMGTATYFSPEQAQGLSLDPRSDLYALGIVLYELVTGRPPFSGESPVAIAYKHVHERPRPPRSANAAIPASLEAVILQLLEKEPAHRYRTADDLRADLRRFREGFAVRATAAGAAGAAGAAAAAGAGATTAVPAQAVGPDATRVGTAYDDGSTRVSERPGGYPPPPERRSWGFVVVLIVLLAVLAGLLFLLARALGIGDDEDPTVAQVEVVDVIDQPFEAARALLEDELGFVVEPTDRVVTDPEQIGVVLDQNPQGGIERPEGSTIELTVGAAELFEMPDLTGETIERAGDILEGLGYTGVAVPRNEENDEVPEGEIIRTDPPEGTDVATTASIELFVSGGPGQVTIEDVATFTESDAISTLRSQDLNPRVGGSEPSDTVEEGRVVRTEPPAGTPVDPESTVTLILSSGPEEPDEVEVPPVIGLDEESATQRLEDEGLEVRVQQADVPPGDDAAGTVIDQDPAGGTEQRPGARVTITVAVESGDGGNGPPDVGD